MLIRASTAAVILLVLPAPARAVDCNRLPQVCAEQAAKPVVAPRRAKVVRKIRKFRRQAVQVRRGKPSAAAPLSSERPEPIAHLAPRPAETLMYRQIVPVLVATTTEPRIIPLPSQMPDLTERTYRIEAPRIASPATGWSRSREGKTAIGLLVLALAIGSVAYALDQNPKGKRHAAARQTPRRRTIADRLGQLGARTQAAQQPHSRIEPHFA